jgi:hypothetical protein
VSCPGRDALDACAAGETAPERAAAIEAHARGCGICGPRLEWLCRENEAIRAWAAPHDAGVERLWAGIRSGIARKPRRRWIPAAALAMAAGAVVAVLVVHGNRETGAEETASAVNALARAEVDYARAVETLETQVAARHPAAGRQSSALGRARTGLQRARASAGKDASARARILEGYAAYLKSLRRALQDEDEP